jgi:hypothetical protein
MAQFAAEDLALAISVLASSDKERTALANVAIKLVNGGPRSIPISPSMHNTSTRISRACKARGGCGAWGS